MIRFTFNLLIFLVGLAGAAIWFGEMRHLRQAVDGLPLWSGLIYDNARVFEGGAALKLPGLPRMEATWQGRLPQADGLYWDARLSGDGLEALADVSLSWWLDKVVLKGGQGTASLEPLTLGQAEGLYRIVDLSGEISLRKREGGHVTIQLDPTTPLPPEAISALSRIGSAEATSIRLPVTLP